MEIDHSKLEPGQKVSGRRYRLDLNTVSRYMKAVGAGSPKALERHSARVLAPPMSVAALSLRYVVEDLRIPEGTLHTGQELQFSRSVAVDEMLECNATITQNSIRGEWRFIVVSQEVLSEDGLQIMTGKSTIVLPV